MKTYDDFEAYKVMFRDPSDERRPKVGEVIRCKIGGEKVKAKVRRIKLVQPRLLQEAVAAGEVDPFLVMAAHPVRGFAVWLAEVSPVQDDKAGTPDDQPREDTTVAKKRESFRQKVQPHGENRAKCAVHVCNGDPHPSVADKSDKDACAKAWEADCDKHEAKIEEIAKAEGMTVEYNGVYPTFKTKDGVTIYWG